MAGHRKRARSTGTVCSPELAGYPAKFETTPQAGPDPVMAALAQARLPPAEAGYVAPGGQQPAGWLDRLPDLGLVAAVTLGLATCCSCIAANMLMHGLPNFDEHGNDR